MNSLIFYLQKSRYAVWLVVGLLVFSNGVNARDWESNYAVSTTLGHDDNFRLSENDQLDTTWLDLGLSTDFRGSTEVSELRLAAGVNHASYSESSIDDETSYNLSLETSRTGERLDSFVSAVLRSELITETELLDTGFTEEDGTRDTVNLRPGISYRVSERNTVSTSLDFEDVNYDSDAFTEYSESSVQLDWSYRMEEDASILSGFEISEYDPDDGDETDTKSLYLGYEWSTSEVTTYLFSIGYTDVDEPGNSDEGGIFRANVGHELDERNRFALSMSTSFEPSGGGEVREEDRLNLQWDHALSDRTQATITAEAVETDERDYYSVTIGGSYQYTREVRFSASYRYRQRDEGIEDADSSAVLVSLFYSPI